MSRIEYENQSIKWLQLSDLHIGSVSNRWTDKTIRQQLNNLFNEEIHTVDFVVITGDIIDKGQLNNQMNIDSLIEFISILSDFTKRIIVTPGNHDYIRNELRTSLLEKWKKSNKAKENDYKRKLIDDFNDLETILKNSKFNVEIDYIKESDVIKIDDLNIVVINTSIFAGQPELDEDGIVVLDLNGEQCFNDDGYIWVCQTTFPSYNSIDNKLPSILVGHHPIEYMENKTKELFVRFMKSCEIKHYFCGHSHLKNNNTINDIIQYTSAGLFLDDYNTPSFSLYTMKKNYKSISQKSYYWDDCWKQLNTFAQTTNQSTKQSELFVSDPTYYIEPSDISDGAYIFPYGKGRFNIYKSNDNPGSITIPHKHDNVDEITYVTKGSVISFVDNKLSVVHENNAIKMPKGKIHGFLPASYPCEYITMSVENSKTNSYHTDWHKDIEDLEALDKQLEEGGYDLEKYDDVINYLNSSIMEVRWKAKYVLNKRLVRENGNDNDYIRESIGKSIRPAIRSKKIDNIFSSLSIAYELGIDINNQQISELLKVENYMVTWICAYYIMKFKKNIDFKKLMIQLLENDCTNWNEQMYYKSCLLMIMQLIVNKNSSLLKDYYDIINEKRQLSYISFDMILMYFVMWYTSYTYPEEILNFSKASIQFNSILGGEGEEVLRGFINVQDHEEKYIQLSKCFKQKKIVETSCAYFENITTRNDNESQSNQLLKDRIQNYLRIIVSEKCNLNCAYCHHEGRIDSLIGGSVVSNNEFNLKELLKKSSALKFKKIKISGGEPLLYPNILSICNEFQNDFEDIGFTTNGTRINSLKDEFNRISSSKLSFNVTLNSVHSEKNKNITGFDSLELTQKGIEFLIENGFKVKINTVVTSYNFDEITDIISYAARQKVNIKLLDLFSIDKTPDQFKHVSIAEIKNEVMKKFRLTEEDFKKVDDYLISEVMGIKVLIPSRVYSIDCQYNCKMYPCAEGIFGIRVYEDYSCARCFNGKVYKGTLDELDNSIIQIRKELNMIRLSY